MESGYMYYLTDRSIQLEVARRRRDASQPLSRTVSSASTLSSPPRSPLLVQPRSPGPADYPGRKDSLFGRTHKMGTHVLNYDAGILSAFDSSDALAAAGTLDLRDGRPFLRHASYPLPCDLAELHRQNLHTMMSEAALSGPVCASFSHGMPRKVLEVGCGSGYWSSTCHDYFKSLGHSEVSFVGLDIVPLAPDLGSQDLKWSFVQHDLRALPWPFPDGTFDYIMLKDVSLAIPLDLNTAIIEECTRVLSQGGTLEIRDSNHVVRCLLPQSGSCVADTAAKTYAVTRKTAFGPAQNTALQEANAWIEQACNVGGVACSPCDNVVDMLARTNTPLHSISSRRVAIPMTRLAWEGADGPRPGSKAEQKSPSKGKTTAGSLTAEQAAVRHTALMVTIQKIESLAPVLREVSGKTTEEWSSWWANMVSRLMQPSGVSGGECIEIGAWWATKGPAA